MRPTRKMTSLIFDPPVEFDEICSSDKKNVKILLTENDSLFDGQVLTGTCTVNYFNKGTYLINIFTTFLCYS